jgi:hypothetical protein
MEQGTMTKPTISWRDVLKIHPAAEIFPLMGDDERRNLGEDIRKHGLTSPIAVTAKLELLDGRNRLDAMESVGIHFTIERNRGSCLVDLTDSGLRVDDVRRLASSAHIVETDPYAFVISANIHRRHLTAEQRREIIGKLIKATPEKPDRQIAETVKVSPTTVGAVRAEMEAKGDVSKLDTRTDSKGRKQPAKKARPTNASSKTKNAKLGTTTKATTAATPTTATPAARDDIGANSRAELARLRAHIEELEHEKRRLEIENIGLRSEIEELKRGSV